jgi:hypothetical protein
MLSANLPSPPKRQADQPCHWPRAGGKPVPILRNHVLKRDGFSSNRHPALHYCWSIVFSDLPSPAEASGQTTNRAKGFAQAGNRFSLFGIML